MSLVLSDTSLTNEGILQRIEDRCGFNPGDITSNTVLIRKFVAKINAYQTKAWSIIIPASGKWQWDDNNLSSDPYITHTITSGQRDYHWLNDSDGNRVLDIYKVEIKQTPTSTIYQEIYPVDVQSDQYPSSNYSFLENTTITGVPTQYEKMGNGLIFDAIPNYTATAGLRMYVNREGYYFLTTDTTTKPGFDGRFHEYLVVGPSSEYAIDKGLPNKNDLIGERIEMEKAIKEAYSQRERDVRKVMTGRRIKYI